MKPVVQTQVILSKEGAAWLAEQAIAIRRTSGAAVSRSKLLRGIVGGLMQARVDFSRCTTEADVAGMLAFLLQALRRG